MFRDVEARKMRSRHRGNITYALVTVNLETDRASEIGSIPVPLGSRFQFSLNPLSRLARHVRRLAFVEQAKLHSAGGCNFAARIRQTGIRLFDPCSRRGKKRRETATRERKRDTERETHEERRARRLQQVVKYERRVVRFKHHLCLSIKFTRLSFQQCAGCHFASPITVSYSRTVSHPPFHRATIPPSSPCSAIRFVSFRSSRSLPRGRTNYPPVLLHPFGVYECRLSSHVPGFLALCVHASNRDALCHPL